MRVKYKPKPKIPASSALRERETTPSAETRKESTPAPQSGEPTTNISPSSVDRVSRVLSVDTPEPLNIPVSTTSYTTSLTVNCSQNTLTCSAAKAIETTSLSSHTYLTSGTTLGVSAITGITRTSNAVSDIGTSHLTTNTVRTSSTDYLYGSGTSSIVTSDNDRQNSDCSNHIANDQFNSSLSFGEGLPCGIQAESVTICDDNCSLYSDNSATESSIILQPSSHRYPSFIESLSPSVLSQLASSHRALGLDQPTDDELVSVSAVEATYRRRCYEEESEANDEEMDVFDSCVDDRFVANSSVNHSQPQRTEIAAEVEVGSDDDNDDDNDDNYEPVAKDGDEGDDDDATNQGNSKRRRKQPEPKKKRKGSQSGGRQAAKKQRKLSTDDPQQKNKSSDQLAQKQRTAAAIYRRRKEAPDVTKMTMSELTKYNPRANPMQSTVEARRRRRELKKGKNGVSRTNDNASTTSSPSSNAREKSPDVELVYEENDLTSRLVPQLTVGEDGQIILNERSLTVEATQVERELDSDVIYESSSTYTTSHRYTKKPFYIKNWNEKETQKFYEILSKTGTDFTMMTLWFPERTRMEIKRKFKREEKRNPTKISQALKKIVPVSVNNQPPQGDT